MKKIKVLNVFNELRYSGAEIRILNGYEIWDREEIDNHILSTGDDEIGLFSEEFEKLNFKVFHIPFRKNLTFFFKFYQFIKKNDYDIIHVFPERASFYYVLISWIAGIKVVRSICNYFEFHGFLRKRKRIERYLIRKLKCIQISVSKSVSKNELKSYKNETRVIENWFNDKKYFIRNEEEYKNTRSELNFPLDRFIIVSVGNCNSTKNHSLIIRSISKLKTKLNNLLYIHIGEEEKENPEQELAKKLGVEDHILFLGYQKFVRKYLAVSDAFVFPSFFEGFPNSPIEALSVGVPVVLTDVPGSSDLRDLPAVFMMESIDEESLIGEILKIYKLSFEERVKLGMVASSTVNRGYNTERGISELIQIYREE